MKLEILEGNINYVARIVQIEQILPIEGADKIAKTFVGSSTVIISNSIEVGDIMIYFCSGTQLSQEYCYINNLFEKPDMNNDKEKKGFINSKRRVRAIKLKGEISDGMLMPLSSLSYIESFVSSDLKLNDEFNTIDGVHICKKYYIEEHISKNTVEKNGKSSIKLKNILVDGQFNFHYETSHLDKNLTKISLDDYIIITAKLHGSSAILSNVLIRRELKWKEKILNWFGANIKDVKYGHIYSSGKPRGKMIKGVIDGFVTPNNQYGDRNVWETACKDYGYALEKGISIYGEICNNGRQKGYDYKKLHPIDKDYAFVVYRITRTNEFGNVDEFSWNQIEQYCKKYNLMTAPVYFKGKLSEFIKDHRDITSILSNKYLEKNCEFCENVVPNEGICVRMETGVHEVFKLKSKKFNLKEDKAQEAGEINSEEE